MTGPFRSPAQMLADQVVDDHASFHDDRTASSSSGSVGVTAALIPRSAANAGPIARFVGAAAFVLAIRNRRLGDRA
jgi:hypothetical protein